MTTENKKSVDSWEEMMAKLKEWSMQKDPVLAARAEEERKRREAEEFAWQEEQRLEREERERIWEHQNRQNNSIWYFMQEADCLRSDPQEKTPSAVLYESYCRWCAGEDIFPQSSRSFCLELKRNALKYKIAPTNFIWQGRHIRGFRGVAVIAEANTQHTDK